MADFYIKQGDRLPIIEATLEDQDGAIDLTGATVEFHMRHQDGEPELSAAATIVSAAAGTVKYEWAVGDTDVGGTYSAEWEITKAGKQVTCPNDGHLTVRIISQLA